MRPRLKGKFIFIYEAQRNGSDEDLLARVISAPSLEEAATQMAEFMSMESERKKWEDPAVDYEAEKDGQYLDLYSLGESHPISNYLY
jgi:hypothetical protein